MKNILLSIILIVVGLTAKSQTVRYFEFKQPLDTTLTSFIVATSDSTVISDVLNDIALPINNRRFISGNVTNGNGGFNHDGINWHTWHFIPNEWQLTSSNVEYCDGISSNIGNNPSVIAGDTIYFCPWDSYPFQEVDNPGLSIEDLYSNIKITIYPNPSSDKIFFEWASSNNLSINIYNITGQHILTTNIFKQQNEIDVRRFREGFYFITIRNGKSIRTKKLIIQH